MHKIQKFLLTDFYASAVMTEKIFNVIKAPAWNERLGVRFDPVSITFYQFVMTSNVTDKESKR